MAAGCQAAGRQLEAAGRDNGFAGEGCRQIVVATAAAYWQVVPRGMRIYGELYG